MIVTLLSDFGTQDTYVGVMKGVIKTIAPEADLVDLTHEIPPQDIAAGAFALHTACRHFPAGTIHLAVVDPGVGSTRFPIAAQIGEYVYVCPDNGLLSYILAEDAVKQAVTLTQTRFHRPILSRTFHGRDIFAPVAAHLSRGVPLDALGAPLDALTTFALSHPHVSHDKIVCHVIHSDVYGNVLTDLTEDIYEMWNVSGSHIHVGGRHIDGPLPSYSGVPPGMPLALFSSAGHLELAVRGGSARAMFALRVGDTVEISRNA